MNYNQSFLYFFSIFISFTISLSAQNVSTDFNSKRELSEVEFKKVVEDYLQMTTSELYLNKQKAQLEFVSKTGNLQIDENIINKDGMRTFFKMNFHKTEFKSEEEILASYDNVSKLQSQVIKDNSSLFKTLARASVEQLMIILKPETESTKQFFMK